MPPACGCATKESPKWAPSQYMARRGTCLGPTQDVNPFSQGELKKEEEGDPKSRGRSPNPKGHLSQPCLLCTRGGRGGHGHAVSRCRAGLLVLC